MKQSENLLALGEGGHLAFSEYGDPNGAPVFFCHGWPSSRTMAELTDAAARKLGLRIISPDRPGIRESKFHPNRTLLDWPPLLCELAAHLRIDKFKILAIAVVSGAPPIAELQDRSGLLALYSRLLALRGSSPGLLRVLFHIARPFA